MDLKTTEGLALEYKVLTVYSSPVHVHTPPHQTALSQLPAFNSALAAGPIVPGVILETETREGTRGNSLPAHAHETDGQSLPPPC